MACHCMASVVPPPPHTHTQTPPSSHVALRTFHHVHVCHCAPSNNSGRHSATGCACAHQLVGTLSHMGVPSLQWGQEVELSNTFERGLRPTSPHTAEEVILAADGILLHGWCCPPPPHTHTHTDTTILPCVVAHLPSCVIAHHPTIVAITVSLVCMCTSVRGDAVKTWIYLLCSGVRRWFCITFARGVSPTSPHTADEVISTADGMSSHGWCCPSPPPPHTHVCTHTSTAMLSCVTQVGNLYHESLCSTLL